MSITINTICVCGAGTMGSGIAQAAAQSGLSTILYELNPAVLEKARAGIEKNLQSIVEKGKISAEEKIQVLKRLQFTGEIKNCVADLFIEAIVEKADIKINLFNQLAAFNSEQVIFATNTSSLPIAAIAAGTSHPERVVGMHFFNPATIMKLVEVIHTTYNSDAIISTIVDLAKRMGKTPVVCKDSPGFIVNRVARPYYTEALRLVEENITDYKQADALLEATGFKMGPFRLMDLIGNDVNYAVSCSVYDQLGKMDRLKPSYIQEEKVKTGHLGRKTKKGFYDYE